MWIDLQIGNKRKLNRLGIVSKVNLNRENIDGESIKIDKVSKELRIINGSDKCLIVSEIGISEKSIITYCFVDDYILIELKKGSLYVKGVNDEVFEISKKLKKNVEVDNKKKSELYWKSVKDFLEYSSLFVEGKYGVNRYSKENTEYIKNLFISVELSYNHSNNKLFTIKLIKMIETLGCGVFKFIHYENERKIENLETYVIDDNIQNKKDNKNSSEIFSQYSEDMLEEYEYDKEIREDDYSVSFKIE